MVGADGFSRPVLAPAFHHHVEPTELRHDLLHGGFDLTRLRAVGDQADRPIETVRGFLRLVSVDVDDSDASAFVGQATGDARADPSRAS